MDGDTIWMMAVAIAFVAVFVVLIRSGAKAEQRFKDALSEMAAARGWIVNHETFGKGRGFVVTPADGGDWSLEVRRRQSSRSTGAGGRTTGSSSPGRSEFRVPDPALPGGLAVFMPGSRDGAEGAAFGEAASSIMGLFDNSFGRAMLGRLLGPDMGEHVGALQSFPSPPGSGLQVLATADPSLWFDLAAIGRTLAGWQPSGRMEAPPQMIVGEAGLRIMVPRELSNAEAVAQMVDVGLALRACAARRR